MLHNNCHKINNFIYYSGYLHGHVSYLTDECQACLLLLTVDADLFHELSEAKKKITEVNNITPPV